MNNRYNYKTATVSYVNAICRAEDLPGSRAGYKTKFRYDRISWN